MTRGPWLFQEFAATWRFDQVETSTRVTFIYHFKIRPAFFRHVVRLILAFEIKRRLRDLKKFAESTYASDLDEKGKT